MAGVIYVGSTEFAADLQQFSDAIGTVSAGRDAISADIDAIKTQFQLAESFWVGPACQSFESFTVALDASMQNLLGLLDDIVSGMSATYQNYQNAETSNTGNLT